MRTPLVGHVEFSNVTFKYLGASEPALRRHHVRGAEGTTLGIMGRSGSGKTTVTRLLQRLHSNYEGLIKIDGIDVREYDVDHFAAASASSCRKIFCSVGRSAKRSPPRKPMRLSKK